MDTAELKTELQRTFDNLKALEERARKLVNQNLADIAASAHGKIKQLIDHPDTELVADTHKDQSVNPDGTPNAGFANDAKRPFRSGTEIGGPDRGKPDVHVPGEPRFDPQNQNFRQPNAVDLNPDGTLRQAPNDFGARPDVRK